MYSYVVQSTALKLRDIISSKSNRIVILHYLSKKFDIFSKCSTIENKYYMNTWSLPDLTLRFVYMLFEKKLLQERNVCVFILSYKSYSLSTNYTVYIKHI